MKDKQIPIQHLKAPALWKLAPLLDKYIEAVENGPCKNDKETVDYWLCDFRNWLETEI